MQAIRANGVNNFNYNTQTKLVDPKNLLAIDRVRCNNCSKYFPLTEIHNHLKTHQIYNGTVGVGDPNRLPISRIAPIGIDHELGYNSNRKQPPSGYVFSSTADIQTMIPEELPNPDNIRKKIPLPMPGSVLRDDQQFAKDGTVSATSTISNFPRPDGLPGLQINPSEIQDIAESTKPEEYFQKIDVNRTRLQVNPKSIPLYSNHTNIDKDDVVIKKKEPVIPTSASKSDRQWKVQSGSIPTRPETTGKIESNRKSYVVEDKGVLGADEKNPKIDTRASNKISIIGGRPRPTTPSEGGIGQGPTSSTCGNWCGTQRQRSPETDLPTHTHYGKRNNFACSACGGFFCPVCKSTVPPQFRPPPGYKEYLEHSRSTHHTLFANTPSRD